MRNAWSYRLVGHHVHGAVLLDACYPSFVVVQPPMKQLRLPLVSCRECGTPIAGRRAGSVFCRTKCKSDWNNRRRMRGADMYDLIMAMRFDREAAEGAYSLLSQFASRCRDADKANRAGRKSWSFDDAFERLSTYTDEIGDGR